MTFNHQLVERVGFSVESIFRYLFSLIPLFASDSSCTSCVISAKLIYIDCHKSAVSSCSLSVSVYRSVGFVISLLSLLSFFSFPSLLSFLPDICHSYIELRCVCVVCSFFFLFFPTFILLSARTHHLLSYLPGQLLPVIPSPFSASSSSCCVLHFCTSLPSISQLPKSTTN